jgi:vacuolar-type H+-ATPase subunit C/Vma6
MVADHERQRYSFELATEFVFAKVHAQWAGALHGERLRRMLEGDARQSLWQMLQAWGIDAGTRTLVQKRLIQRLLTQLGKIRQLLDPPSASLYTRFMDRCHLANLKVLIHHHYVQREGVDLEYLLIDSPELPALDLEKLGRAADHAAFRQALPETVYTSAVKEILETLEDDGDIFQAECRLDILYFHTLLSAVGGLPLRSRRVAAGLFRQEIDGSNLVMVLRNLALYHLPAERLEALLIPGGELLTGACLAQLVRCQSYDALLASLPAHLSGLLRRVGEDELERGENLLWSELFHRARGLFRDFSRPQDSIVVFPLLKWFETQNLARLYEALRFRVTPDNIADLLISGG